MATGSAKRSSGSIEKSVRPAESAIVMRSKTWFRFSKWIPRCRNRRESMIKQNILVTGGAGYIGSVLCPALLEAGHKVTVLDAFLYKVTSLALCCANPNFDVVRGDCRNEHLIKDLVRHVDVVIPLAALVGAPLSQRDAIGT